MQARPRLLSVLAAVLLLSSCGSPNRTAHPLAVSITDTAGNSKHRTSPAGPWQPAKVSDVVPQEGAVRTGKDGALWLDLPGGGVANVKPDSELAVTELVKANEAAGASSPAETALELLRGVGLFRWEAGSGELTVKTPHAHAAVLGTEFALEISAQSTRLLVARGRVRVETSAGERIVSASQQLLIDPNGPLPQPTPVRLIGAEGVAGQLERFSEAVRGLRNRRDIDRR